MITPALTFGRYSHAPRFPQFPSVSLGSFADAFASLKAIGKRTVSHRRPKLWAVAFSHQASLAFRSRSHSSAHLSQLSLAGPRPTFPVQRAEATDTRPPT